MKKKKTHIFRFHFDATLVDVDVEALNIREAFRIMNKEHPEYSTGFMILRKDESGSWIQID